MGQTLSYAERMKLAAMVPHAELSSTKFCLAGPGREYLVYLPQGREVTVDLGAASGKMSVEWRRTADRTVTRPEPISAGGHRALRAPFDGDAVLYLRSK